MTPRQVSSLGAGRTKESAPRFSHGPVEEKSHTSRAPRLGPPRPSRPSLLPEATGQDGAPERSGHRPAPPACSTSLSRQVALRDQCVGYEELYCTKRRQLQPEGGTGGGRRKARHEARASAWARRLSTGRSPAGCTCLMSSGPGWGQSLRRSVRGSLSFPDCDEQSPGPGDERGEGLEGPGTEAAAVAGAGGG